MALNLGSPSFSRLSHPSPHLSKNSSISSNSNNALWILLLSRCNDEIYAFKHLYYSISSSFLHSKNFKIRASVNERDSGNSDNSASELLDEELLTRISGAKDAEIVLEMIAEKSQRNGGVVGTPDCCLIIAAALDRNNADLALSVFSAMRSSFDQGILISLVSFNRCFLRGVFHIWYFFFFLMNSYMVFELISLRNLIVKLFMLLLLPLLL